MGNRKDPLHRPVKSHQGGKAKISHSQQNKRSKSFDTKWKKRLRNFVQAIVKAIYFTGLFVLGIWDRFEERGGFRTITQQIKKGLSVFNKQITAGTSIVWHKVSRFARLKTEMVHRRWKERRHYKPKVRALAILTGTHASDIKLPFTEEEKAIALHKSIRRVTQVVVPVFAILSVSMIVYTAKSYVLGVRVSVDGKEIGILESQEAYDQLAKQVEEYINNVTGVSYHVTLKPEFQAALVKRSDTKNTNGITEKIYAEATNVISESYGLYIDGQILAVNMNGQGIRDQLQRQLDKVATGAPNERVEFIQTVEVKKGMMPKNLEHSLVEIDDMLNETAVREQTYTVVPGDTMGAIAQKFGMSVSALQKMNPDVNPTSMRDGTKLIVQSAEPRLAIKLVRTETYNEPLPFETEKISTDSLYQNQTKVQVDGVEGELKITADVTIIGGKEVERTELSREVIREPVTKQMLVGTKKLPAKAATGTMRRPVGGVISSSYGKWRGSSRHTGVDFANPTGTPVVAADGGKVISAGWAGGYGYCIVIDHGNGLKTRYAHCSKLLISAGESVAKGQTIARVGSTGNSTGPHLHFEVIKNGSHVNPFNYIK